MQRECERTLSTNSHHGRVKQTLATNGVRSGSGCSCGLTDHITERGGKQQGKQALRAQRPLVPLVSSSVVGRVGSRCMGAWTDSGSQS